MYMKTVVVALEAGTFSRGIKKELRDTCRVLWADKASDLEKTLAREEPQVLLLDLQLPGLDPLELLRELREGEHFPRVLAITRFVSGYLLQALPNLGISYLLVWPCRVESVSNRIVELLEPLDGEEAQLRSLLRRFCVPLELSGGQCLLSAIPKAKNHFGQYLTKELYPAVGREMGMDWHLVERNIRHAILRAWESGDKELWLRNFPSGRPTNGEFICRMVELSKETEDFVELAGIKQNFCG